MNVEIKNYGGDPAIHMILDSEIVLIEGKVTHPPSLKNRTVQIVLRTPEEVTNLLLALRQIAIPQRGHDGVREPT